MCSKISTCIIKHNSYKATRFPILNGTYQLGIANTIAEIANEWQLVQPANECFLQIPYLQFLESRPPGDMHFRYLLFYKKDKPIGLAYCQISELKIGEALTDPTLSSFRQKINNTILQVANMNAIFCGNILLTGAPGSHFLEDIDKVTQSLLLKEGLECLQNKCKNEGEHISLLLVKDIATEQKDRMQADIGTDYKEFSIQPKMILNIRKEWNTFEDYLGAMSSKYRVRAKRAFKKGIDFEKRELNLESIKAFLPRIDELYKSIAEGAGFNVVTLDGEYFLNFKEHFPEQFKVHGYFLNEELVAFYTTFRNHEEFEAHFLGFDNSLNRTHQIYLNILYDLVRHGIADKAGYINFARTALEIKSSVGAVAVDLFYLGKHTNSFKNTLFTPILAYFNPKVEWTPRSPFKE